MLAKIINIHQSTVQNSANKHSVDRMVQSVPFNSFLKNLFAVPAPLKISAQHNEFTRAGNVFKAFEGDLTSGENGILSDSEPANSGEIQQLKELSSSANSKLEKAAEISLNSMKGHTSHSIEKLRNLFKMAAVHAISHGRSFKITLKTKGHVYNVNINSALAQDVKSQKNTGGGHELTIKNNPKAHNNLFKIAEEIINGHSTEVKQNEQPENLQKLISPNKITIVLKSERQKINFPLENEKAETDDWSGNRLQKPGTDRIKTIENTGNNSLSDNLPLLSGKKEITNNAKGAVQHVKSSITADHNISKNTSKDPLNSQIKSKMAAFSDQVHNSEDDQQETQALKSVGMEHPNKLSSNSQNGNSYDANSPIFTRAGHSVSVSESSLKKKIGKQFKYPEFKSNQNPDSLNQNPKIRENFRILTSEKPGRFSEQNLNSDDNFDQFQNLTEENISENEPQLTQHIPSKNHEGKTETQNFNHFFNFNTLFPANPASGLSSTKMTGNSTIKQSMVPEMLQRILENAHGRLVLSGQKLEVQLEVENLGKIVVDAAKQREKIHLQINVENNETRSWLESHVRPILDHINKIGIEVDKFEVSVGNQKMDQQFQEKGPAQPNNRHVNNLSNLMKISQDYVIDESLPPQLIKRDFGYNTVEVWI